jgi:hypothetical protein
MARQPDPAVEAAWRQRMVRFARWDRSIAAFCDDEGVSTAAFYSWRRRLGTPSAARTTPARRGDGERTAREAVKAEASRPVFLPVVVTGDAPVSIQLGEATIRLGSTDHELVRLVVRELAAAARWGDKP